LDRPPGDSLEPTQRGAIVDPDAELIDALRELLQRVSAEIAYSEAKGSTPYHAGMQDGLRFAADALAATLEAHGAEPPGRVPDA
jgi:hypothetical protein